MRPRTAQRYLSKTPIPPELTTKFAAHDGKRRYRQVESAAEVARGMRLHGHDVYVYRCPYCQQYHIGHTPSVMKLEKAG
jgi:hypothetical protein